jgi:hypothetical protein
MHYDTLVFVLLMVFTLVERPGGSSCVIPWFSTALSLVIVSLRNVNRDTLKVSTLNPIGESL